LGFGLPEKSQGEVCLHPPVEAAGGAAFLRIIGYIDRGEEFPDRVARSRLRRGKGRSRRGMRTQASSSLRATRLRATPTSSTMETGFSKTW
jgi:hypothetical protein